MLVGKAGLLEQAGISLPRLTVDKGLGTVVYISVDGDYVGQLTISDRVKADSPELRLLA